MDRIGVKRLYLGLYNAGGNGCVASTEQDCGVSMKDKLENELRDLEFQYQEIEEERDELQAQAKKYREALESIVKHQEIVSGGEMAEISTTRRIAKQALQTGDE